MGLRPNKNYGVLCYQKTYFQSLRPMPSGVVICRDQCSVLIHKSGPGRLGLAPAELLLQHGPEVVRERPAVTERAAGDFESAIAGKLRESARGEIIDVVRMAESAPLGPADRAVDATVIGHLDDDRRAGLQDAAKFAKQERGLRFMLEEAAEERGVERVWRELRETGNGIGLDDPAPTSPGEGIGFDGQDAGDFDAVRLVAVRRKPGEDAAAATTDIEDLAARQSLKKQGSEFVALQDALAKMAKGATEAFGERAFGVAAGLFGGGGFLPGEILLELNVTRRILEVDKAAFGARFQIPWRLAVGTGRLRVVVRPAKRA